MRFSLPSSDRAPLWSLLGCLLAALLSITPSAAQQAEIQDVRFGVDARARTRIVLDVTADPWYRAYLIDKGADGKQLAIEIDAARFDIGGKPSGAGSGIGHIGSFGYSTDSTGLSSVVFHLDKTAVPDNVFLIEPRDGNDNYRLVVDMAGASDSAFAGQIAREHGPMKGGNRLPRDEAPLAQKDATEPAAATNTEEDTAMALAALQRAQTYAALDDVPVPRIKPERLRAAPAPGNTGAAMARAGSRKIIIDAGHGGKDPGAIGQSGNYEKTVTLAAAKTLRDVLTGRGYEVVMTRAGDEFIDLEDRMPRRAKEPADLFISIHADSIANKEVRGASVYTLSKKGDLRLANQINRMKEEGDAVIGNVDLSAEESDISAIIADLSVSRAQESSSLFAGHLIEHLDGRIPIVTNGHREENLKVLLAPDMPAVLLELGFMSNIHDEANLIREEWRKGAMTAVADSIDAYFLQHFPSRHVSLTEGAH